MLHLERLEEGIRTRILRVAIGMSQNDLAAQAGVDRRRISEHERGERSLRGEELVRVLAALHRASGSTAHEETGVAD